MCRIAGGFLFNTTVFVCIYSLTRSYASNYMHKYIFSFSNSKFFFFFVGLCFIYTRLISIHRNFLKQNSIVNPTFSSFSRFFYLIDFLLFQVLSIPTTKSSIYLLLGREQLNKQCAHDADDHYEEEDH